MRPHHTAADITSPLLANGRVFWSLVTAILAAMIMLTGWTAVRASAVAVAVRTLDRVIPPEIAIDGPSL